MKILSFIRFSLPLFFNHNLWKNKKFLPIFRFFKLHFIFLINKNNFVFSWINNMKISVSKGDTGMTGNYYFGLHEYEDMAFLMHFLNENDRFLDIGSNNGSYSLLAAGVVNAKTISIEPVPSTYKKLCKNVKLNNLEKKIKSLNFALTSSYLLSKKDFALFSVDRGPMNSFVKKSYKGQTQHIRLSTLDNVCQGNIPSLIKIDVEGFESDVLKGGEITLRDKKLKVVIAEGDSFKVRKIMKKLKFSKFSYYPPGRKLIKVQTSSRNVIWIKQNDLQMVKNRLKESKDYFIYGLKI